MHAMNVMCSFCLGGGVVTTRAHVRYVATEYGVVDLFGKSILERAKLLISISHPDHHGQLTKAARERFGKLVTNVF
jgi:acyl-CoA hydrolase